MAKHTISVTPTANQHSIKIPQNMLSKPVLSQMSITVFWALTLDVVDANGNYGKIGTKVSNAYGTYSLTWTPDFREVILSSLTLRELNHTILLKQRQHSTQVN
jgi:hypothetical protein